MGVSNPRDDRAEQNLGVASVPLSTVIPRVGNLHLQQNPISDSYIPIGLSGRHNGSHKSFLVCGEIKQAGSPCQSVTLQPKTSY